MDLAAMAILPLFYYLLINLPIILIFLDKASVCSPVLKLAL